MMDKNSERYDLVVAGSGPAGLAGAISAASSGARVILLEKESRSGGKIPISGGGRCNLAHAEYDFKELVRDGLKVRVVSELGGRIMELSLDGFNFLFVNPVLNGAKNIQPEKSWNGIWQNFGGEKIWPAPQGWDTDRQWAGPPDNVLDGGYFKILSADENSITTQSPTCARTAATISPP